MRFLKSPSMLGLLLAIDCSPYAFLSSPPKSSRATSNLSPLVLTSKKNFDDEIVPLTSVSDVVALSAIVFGLLVPTSYAQDTQDCTCFPSYSSLQSSSVTTSEVIRTMDLSLPGSYDSISDPVASGADELTSSPISSKSSSPQKKVSQKSSSKSNTSGEKGMGLSFPKLDFGVSSNGNSGTEVVKNSAFIPMKADEKAAVLAQRRAEREEAAAQAKAEAAAREKQEIEERNAKIVANRLERVAKRQEEQLKKEATESEKREETYKGAKVVDTKMPSY